MSFEAGTINVTMFKLSQKLPENFLELFAAYAARPLEEVKDDPMLGWTTGRHLLETQINDATAICGGHLYLNLRKAERKIPALTLKTLCQREEQIYMTANETEFVPAKIKREIRLDIIDKHLMKMTPTLTGIPFVVDLACNMMYAGTTSQSQLDDLVCFFFKTTNVEPIHINIGTLCEDNFSVTESDLPSVTFSAETSGDLTPVRDFLTWLWYFNEMKGGQAGVDYSFELMVEGPLTLAGTDETKGAHDIAIKNGGSPLHSSEAKAALLVGKKLKKAKITIVSDGKIWSCAFDADHFTFSSLLLPDGEEMEHHSMFAERIMHLDIFRQAIQAYFELFVNTVRSMQWQQIEKNIQAWALNRDSY